MGFRQRWRCPPGTLERLSVPENARGRSVVARVAKAGVVEQFKTPLAEDANGLLHVVAYDRNGGIAGAYLSTGKNAAFIRNMTAGQGFIALAALIVGKWRPVPTMLACFLFAFADAVQARLQGVDLPIVGVIPVQFVDALPFVLTVVILAGFIGKSVAPKAGGRPYVKER